MNVDLWTDILCYYIGVHVRFICCGFELSNLSQLDDTVYI